MPTENFTGATLAHPRQWPIWFGFGVLRLISLLPARPRLWIGRLFGRLARRFSRRMRSDVAVNLALCYPKLSEAAREKLLRDHFAAFGCALVEAAHAWWGSDASLGEVEWVGFEHLQSAMATGRGVLLLTGHFTTLEIAARLLSTRVSLDVTYKRDKNPSIERAVRSWRGRHYGRLITSDDVRSLIRRLRDGALVAYAPDQDFPRKGRVFVDFFGVAAATNPATARVAQTTGAQVVPYAAQRIGSRYRVTFLPPLTDFPIGDTEADARAVNAAIEALVQLAPEQYMWRLRRFRTRPDGTRGPYSVK